MKKSAKIPSPLVQKTRKWGPLLLSFLIPFLCFVGAMIVQGCVPFGSRRAILYSDEYHQYYPFFLSLRNTLRNGESLMFNWQIGMGIDYLGLAAYYLGSPLNLLSVLIPDGLTLHYFAILVPIRLGLAGLFFGLMLKKLYGKNDISIALFGSFYALCAWALGYMWNVMWLDTFALLPLVILGAVSLLKDKKFILYTLALFFSITISYYIGFFVCIFVLLVFICYEICRWKGWKRFLGDLLRMGLFSALAIGMTAFLELPALVALGSTNSSVNNFPAGFRLNIITGEEFLYTKQAWKDYQTAQAAGAGFIAVSNALITAIIYSVPPILAGMREIAGNMGGGLTPTFMDGLPNIYCGTCIIVMAFLFLTAKKVKLRDKICSVVLLVFLMCSFLLRQLDYIWHGFHFPNQIPYRFSFLFSFVMVWMAYRAWLLREEFKVWQLVTAGVLSLGILLCGADLTDPLYWGYNLAVLLMTLGLFTFLIIKRKQLDAARDGDRKVLKKLTALHKRNTAWLITFVMLAELAMNMGCFCYYFTTTTITNYPLGTENSAAAISYMKYRERNNLFYRSEVTHTQTYNDAALNNYNGITTFTSSANVHTTDFLQALGNGALRSYNRYAFEETSPVTSLFLNLKYMLERDGNVEENPYFETVHNFGDVYLQENKAYLPLGFLAESTLADWSLKDGTYSFQRQAELFRLATGVEDPLWHMSPNGCLEISSDDVELTTIRPNNGIAHFTTGEKSGTVTFGYTVTKTGFMCIEIKTSKKSDFKLYTSRGGVETLLYDEEVVMPQMFSVAQVKPGDLVWVEIECDENQTGSINMQAGILDEEVFWKGYEVLATSTMELTEFSNTYVEGTIQCNRDGLLYTSIPTNGFWSAEVDGEPAQIVLVGECMVGLELTEGQHTITFRYRNSAFTTGLLISLGSGLLFVGIILLNRYLRNRKGKYHQPVKPQEKPAEAAPQITEPEQEASQDNE